MYDSIVYITAWLYHSEPEPEPEPEPVVVTVAVTVAGNNAPLKGSSMFFEFEKLDVYQVSLDFVASADDVSEALPKGRAYLKDQLRRAANSIAANLAEGVGEFSQAEKIRFYRMSRRSAVECASHLLVCKRLPLVDEVLINKGLEQLHRIVAMQTSMIKSVSSRTQENR